MKVYRIKHKTTGLFYQPIKGRFKKEKSNLGPTGKVYASRKPSLKGVSGYLQISENVCKKLGIEWKNKFEFKESDFEIVEYDCIECKGVRF